MLYGNDIPKNIPYIEIEHGNIRHNLQSHNFMALERTKKVS